MILLECRGVRVNYEDNSHVFSYPDFELEKGTCICLTGRSGHGKTTLLNALLKTTFSGRLCYDRIKLLDKDYSDWLECGNLFHSISYVPQFSQNSLNPSLKLSKQISLIQQSNHNSINREQLSSYIEQLNMSVDILDMYPHELSGGMKQRTALLFAFIKNPLLCFIDEASSAIDYVTQECLMNFLLCRKESGTGIFCISHHKGMVSKLADHVIALEDR